MRATRLNLDSVLKGRTGTNGSSLMRWNRLILVGQVAFSLLLILGAGLFLRTFHNLRDLERGFGTEDTVQFAVRPRGDELNADPGERFVSGLANLPGIDAATNYFFRGPLGNSIRMTPIQVEGYVPAPHESLMASVWRVGPRFFETLAVSLHRGRDFREADLAREPDPFSKYKGDPVQTPDSESAVGVISRNMAEDLFGDRNPIGRKVRVGSTEIEVIGVAEDARYGLLVERPPWVLYRLNYTRAVYANLFAVRTKESLATLAPALQDLVDEIDPGYYVTDLQSLGQLLESTLVRERFMARLASLFGLLALFMVSIGIYGQVAYGVAQRRSELGIRMALGAPAANVLALLAQEMFLVLATGILLGLLAALATTHLVSSLLFGLTPMDPSTIAFSITVLLIAALAASLRPALQRRELTRWWSYVTNEASVLQHLVIVLMCRAEVVPHPLGVVEKRSAMVAGNCASRTRRMFSAHAVRSSLFFAVSVSIPHQFRDQNNTQGMLQSGAACRKSCRSLPSLRK